MSKQFYCKLIKEAKQLEMEQKMSLSCTAVDLAGFHFSVLDGSLNCHRKHIRLCKLSNNVQL